jgi:oligopeptide transport system permease protein
MVILTPRDVEYITSAWNGKFLYARYLYSFDQHIQSVKDFFLTVWETRTLGNYNDYYSIKDILTESLKKSFIIIIPALFLGFFLGLIKGILDYRLSYTKWSMFGKGSTWFFLSIPDFFVVISLQLGLMALYDMGLFPYIDVFGSDKPDNFIMAIIYLMIYPLFYIAKVVSTSFEEEENKDYIRTAKSKGTAYYKILFHHILWNCWVRILSNLSTITLFMLSNLFIIEKFMGYNGAGTYFFDSVTPGALVIVNGTRDLGHANLAIAFTLIFTFFLLIIHIISNIAMYKLGRRQAEDLS